MHVRTKRVKFKIQRSLDPMIKYVLFVQSADNNWIDSNL
jgi:hypothetical protein